MRRLALCVLLLLSAASPTPAHAREAPTLRVVAPQLPSQFDPHRAVAAIDLAVAREIFLGLTMRDAEGRVVPGAAQWKRSDDRLTYTFTLRPDLVWSDGVKVTAEDFVAGLERALAPKTAAPFAQDLLIIAGAEEFRDGTAPRLQGVRAPDRGTVRITLRQPSQRLLDVLSEPVAAPVPRHRLASLGNEWATPANLVGEGAFIPVANSDKPALAKNQRFFAAASVAADLVEFFAAPSAEDAVVAARGSDANIGIGFSAEGLGGARRNLRADTGQDLYFVAVNGRRAILDRREFRHALAMTIDRDGIVKMTRLNEAVVAETFAPPALTTTGARRAAYSKLSPGARTAIAEALLEELNIDPAHIAGFTLSYTKGAAAVAQSLAAAWAQLGVVLRLDEQTQEDQAAALRSGAFDLALTAWGEHQSADALSFLTPFAGTSGPRNISSYADADFNRRLSEADAEEDPATRKILLSDAERLVVEDQIVLPILFFTPLRLVRDVGGWRPNPVGIHPWRFLSP